MEALSHSVSLADLIQKRSAARWTGCSARAFAEAVVAKLEWLCQTESYVADVLGKQAKAKVQYDRAAAANAQCLRGMEVQACEEYTKLAVKSLPPFCCFLSVFLVHEELRMGG